MGKFYRPRTTYKYILTWQTLMLGVFLVVPSGAPNVSFASLDSLCHQVAAIDCIKTYLPDGDETLCGTDDVTYANFCFYAQRRCKSNNLTMKHFGACVIISGDINNTSTRSSSTTMTSPTTTRDIIVQVFCAHVDDNVCPNTLDPVCATNFQFYRNECEFAKARCKDTTLSLQVLENCKNIVSYNRSGA